jgi:flavin-dependent dehydrogenase
MLIQIPYVAHSWDVIVLGAGPAGAVTAKLLAGAGCRVLMLNLPRRIGWSIGETLPPQAHHTLIELGLMRKFEAGPHRPAPGIVSMWGDPEPVARDFLFSPYGNGWHLDRVQFNQMLVEAALSEGAVLLPEVAATRFEHNDTSWYLRILSNGGVARTLRCRLLIDATGRSSTGHSGFPHRFPSDRLIAVACLCSPATGIPPSEYTLIEAVDAGWFYSALVPSGQWVVAYMTDGDLYAAGARRSRTFFACQLEKAPHTRARVAQAPGELSMFSARSSVRSRTALADWLAVGDAARSQDPLSGQGILAAMTMARDAAAAALRLLHGDTAAATEYETSNRRAFDEYRKTQDSYYGQEQRWPESPFWSRRQPAEFSIRR